MIVRDVKNLVAPATVVQGDTWESRRVFVRSDGLGFSVHSTTIRKETVTTIHYRNHVEAVLVISGHGWLRIDDSEQPIELCPGVAYAVGPGDAHTIIADTEICAVCVFNPALVGSEVHDGTGSYPIVGG